MDSFRNPLVTNLPRQFPWSMTLPLIFDDTITLLEKSQLISHKINEIIDVLNSFESNTKTYTDEQIKILSDDVNRRIAQSRSEIEIILADYMAEIQNKFDEQSTEFQALQAEFVALTQWTERKIAEIENSIKKHIDNLIALMSYKDELLYLRIQGELALFKADIINMLSEGYKALSPITGTRQNVDFVLRQITRRANTSPFNLTRAQFAALGVTRDFVKTRLITRDYFVKACYNTFISQNFLEPSPFTGTPCPIAETLAKLAALHDEPISRAEFKALGWTRDYLKSKNISRFDFKNQGALLLN